MLTYTRPVPNVIHVKAENQFELTSTFVRPQEFYESPFDSIRGHYGWTVADLAREYTERSEKFDYFTKWNGMNMPGEVVEDFFAHFSDLSPGEAKLNAILWHARQQGVTRPFYLIGTHDEGDITHEIAHAMYYLDQDYRNRMRALLAEADPQAIDTLTHWLLDDREYSPTVVEDELQAYLATSPLDYLKKKIGPIAGKAIFEAGEHFRTAFKNYTDMEPI